MSRFALSPSDFSTSTSTQVEAAEGLVALEDVLQRPAVAVMHAGRVVRRDRAVHEGEGRAAAVPVAELREDSGLVPPGENLAFESGMVGYRRKRLEDLVAHREAKSRERRSYPW
jgi:hypothetical protein